MDLREYEQKKFTIAEVLRAAAKAVPEDATELRERLQDLFARLAEDRFNLVVVGRFNRGKTSLMNAVLGSNRLPTDIVPLTSVITTVTYGSTERVILKYRNRRLDSEIPIEELPQHITQQGNPANRLGIRTAEVELPAEILRRGFYFVDTPGLGSVVVENTLTTESFLPEADAFVLVTSHDSPLSEDEVRFLKAASAQRSRTFIVVNKHDAISPGQREKVIDFIREQLSAMFGDVAIQIFSASSTEGLQAKLSKNSEQLAASGIPEFENALIHFLLNEKSREFLTRMCSRVVDLMHDLPHWPEMQWFSGRLASLAREFGPKDELPRTLRAAEASESFANLHQLPTCEICAQIAHDLWNFISKYQSDIIIDAEERQRFAVSGGFCPFHAWQLQSVQSPYGICVGYPPLLEQIAAELRQTASAASVDEICANIRTSAFSRNCVACDVRADAERKYVQATAGRLRQQHIVDSLSAICLPHLAMLASSLPDHELLRLLLKREAAVFERSAEDMRRYAVKHDALRRYLASHEESTAAERAVVLVAGRRQVNIPTQTGSLLPVVQT